MAVSTLAGPSITYGITLTSCGIDMEHNPDRGPSVADLGEGLLDPRPPFMFAPGQASSKPFYAWAGLFGGPVVDQAPSAVSPNVIAATQVPVGGTALILNALTSNGFGPAVTINAYEGGTALVRPIDGAMTGLAFGVSGGINLWNPTTAVARTLQITGSSNGSSNEAWSVAGRDLYGQKMTELILGATTGGTVANGKKAWKYISSIVPSTVNGAIGSTQVIVGTNDMFGFPLRIDHPGYVTTWVGAPANAVQVVVSSGYHTLAVSSAATNTTGDVRGTIATSGAGITSTAAGFKVVMFMGPSAQNLQGVSLGSSYPMGIVGLQQFSSV